MSAVTAHECAFAYGDRVALDGVSFEVPPGSVVALIGPNGSGKSTLLRAIAGLHRPERGELTVAAASRRAGVSFVLQTTAVDGTLPLSVRETVNLARYPRAGWFRMLGRSDRAIVDDAMTRMGISGLERRQLSELSGGQRQRALVAQGLAQDAELLLLDEPFTGLDVVSRELIVTAVEAERAKGRTVMVTTHELEDARRADLVLLLAGRVVAFGPPETVLVPAHLTAAYGPRAIPAADGTVFVDDPHHDHHHEHQHDPNETLHRRTGR